MSNVADFFRWIDSTMVEVRLELVEYHEEVQSDAAVGVRQRTPVKTGKAKNSWVEEKDVRGSGYSVVGSDLDYILMLEFGKAGGRTPNLMMINTIKSLKARHQ